MRHGKRHLRYTVSTVLGLTAPALAAVLLTSSVPSTAAAAYPLTAAPTQISDVLHAPGLHEVVVHRTVAAPKPVVVKPVAKPTVRAAVRHTTVRPTVHRTTTTRTATRTTTTRTSSTSQTAQPWGSDDYPYRNATTNAADKWGFTERQCVSFAAWRLAQHGHAITNADNWGSALTWDDAARRLGDTVTTKAHVGAIAQWNAGEASPYYGPGSATANGHFTAGGYGHVGWVKYVYSDGSALVEQYNMGGSRSYSVMRVKAPRYLLIG